VLALSLEHVLGGLLLDLQHQEVLVVELDALLGDGENAFGVVLELNYKLLTLDKDVVHISDLSEAEESDALMAFLRLIIKSSDLHFEHLKVHEKRQLVGLFVFVALLSCCCFSLLIDVHVPVYNLTKVFTLLVEKSDLSILVKDNNASGDLLDDFLSLLFLLLAALLLEKELDFFSVIVIAVELKNNLHYQKVEKSRPDRSLFGYDAL
jgi:hypothetical protein